jgi:hypothetical protein
MKTKIFVTASILLMASLTVLAATANAQTTPQVTIQILDPVGSGTTDPGTGTYNYDVSTPYILTATPADGWVFDHWEITGDFNYLLGVMAPETIQVTENPINGDCGVSATYQYQAVFVEQPSTQASLPSVSIIYVVIIAVIVAAVAAIGAFFVGKKSK